MSFLYRVWWDATTDDVYPELDRSDVERLAHLDDEELIGWETTEQDAYESAIRAQEEAIDRKLERVNLLRMRLKVLREQVRIGYDTILQRPVEEMPPADLTEDEKQSARIDQVHDRIDSLADSIARLDPPFLAIRKIEEQSNRHGELINRMLESFDAFAKFELAVKEMREKLDHVIQKGHLSEPGERVE